ncbi:MAG: XdhC family protein [Deltaproteobacteria bacterium]
MQQICEEIGRMYREGCPGMLVTVVDKKGQGPSTVGSKLLMDGQGIVRGSIGGGELESVAQARARDLMDRRQNGLEQYNLSGEPGGPAVSLDMICGGTVTLFYEFLPVAPIIYILGMGHIGCALSHLMKRLGWRVTEADFRPEARFQEMIEEGRNNPECYVIVAGFSHQEDYDMLEAVYRGGWQPRYIGLLASRKKHDFIAARLREQLGDAIDLSILFSPIGLDIGGKQPDEVALSIAAELQALRYGKQCHRHLSKPLNIGMSD